MSNFSKGKYAKFISVRSGQAFPYSEMVTEWTGAKVHISEFESEKALKTELGLGQSYDFAITTFEPKDQKLTLSFKSEA